MFGRKILFLAAGYVAGNIVSSVYSGGKKKAKKSQGKQDIKLMFEGFLNTQKNFISDVEKKYITQDNKEMLSEKKKEFMKASEKYMKQGEKLLAEVSKNKNVVAGKKAAGGFVSNLFTKRKQLSQKTVSGEKKKKQKKK